MADASNSFLALFRADRQIDPDLRARLVATLFASPASMAAGAAAGSAAAVTVAIRTDDVPSAALGVAIPMLAMARIGHAVYQRRRTRSPEVRSSAGEIVYEAGAWLYSALLGLLAFLVLTRTDDAGLHLLTACVAIGYAAGICARNAGRPAIALGQLALAALPVTPALALSADPAHWVLAGINIIFVIGLAEVTRRTYFAFQSAMSVARAREEQVKDALDHLPQMAWSADSYGAFTHYNRRWTEFTGSSPLEGGGSPAALIHPADWQGFLAEWTHCVETGAPFEAQYRLRQRSGRYRWVLALGAPERDRSGRIVRWHGTITDVEDRKLAQYDAPGHGRSAA